MQRMVVVIDTNVFVAALLGPSGASRRVLRACLEGPLRPLMGSALFAEYEDLLNRSTLFQNSALAPAEREAVLNAFLSACSWIRVYFLWRPNLRDEADNHLIELAVAGGAQAIVTKNVRDFAQTELRFPEVRILKPDQLLQEMTHGHPDRAPS